MKAGDYPDVIMRAVGAESALTETFIKDNNIVEMTDVLAMTVPGEDVTVGEKILPGFVDNSITNPYGDEMCIRDRSLAVQYYAKPYIAANVTPNCFMPRPNVGSAVIRLTKHEKPPVEATDEKLLFRMIRASFNQRRKTLANGLKNSQELSYSKEQIESAIEIAGFPPAVRGEALTLQQLDVYKRQALCLFDPPSHHLPFFVYLGVI